MQRGGGRLGDTAADIGCATSAACSLGSVRRPSRRRIAVGDRTPTGEEGEERHRFADIGEAEASLTIIAGRGTLLAPMRAECR